jgi:hypothetical protein
MKIHIGQINPTVCALLVLALGVLVLGRRSRGVLAGALLGAVVWIRPLAAPRPRVPRRASPRATHNDRIVGALRVRDRRRRGVVRWWSGSLLSGWAPIKPTIERTAAGASSLSRSPRERHALYSRHSRCCGLLV